MRIVADKNTRLVLGKVNLGWVRIDATDNENAMENGNIVIYVAQTLRISQHWRHALSFSDH